MTTTYVHWYQPTNVEFAVADLFDLPYAAARAAIGAGSTCRRRAAGGGNGYPFVEAVARVA